MYFHGNLLYYSPIMFLWWCFYNRWLVNSKICRAPPLFSTFDATTYITLVTSIIFRLKWLHIKFIENTFKCLTFSQITTAKVLLGNFHDPCFNLKKKESLWMSKSSQCDGLSSPICFSFIPALLQRGSSHSPGFWHTSERGHSPC